MRLADAKSRYDQLAREAAPGAGVWLTTWPVFVAFAREPLDEPDTSAGLCVMEVAPAYPPYSEHLNVLLDRYFDVERRSSYNAVEASLQVSIEWQPVGELAALSDEVFESVDVDEFATSVESSSVFQLLANSEEHLVRFGTFYSPPEERD